MRLKVIIGFILFIVLLLLGRVYYLSIMSNEHFEKLSQKNYIKKIHTAASRGSILDRNGKYLAVNRVGFSINIKPHLRSKKSFQNVEEVAALIVKHFPKFKYEKLIKKYTQLDSPYRHDLVKIVDQSIAKKGKTTFREEYNKATYWFSSKENSVKFKENPSKYIPEYGGFCAIAMSEGALVDANPQSFLIQDDKLYLFFSKYFGLINTKNQWLRDSENKRKLADEEWLTLKSE